MDRFTQRDSDGKAYWCGVNGASVSDNKGNIYGDAITRLAEYEDLEEKGLSTESLVYEVEHKLLGELVSTFELDKEKEIANLAIYSEGVRDMAVALVDAFKELKPWKSNQ